MTTQQFCELCTALDVPHTSSLAELAEAARMQRLALHRAKSDLAAVIDSRDMWKREAENRDTLRKMAEDIYSGQLKHNADLAAKLDALADNIANLASLAGVLE